MTAQSSKRPWLHVLISAVAPGIGSFANGELRHGLVIFALWELLIIGLILSAGQDPSQAWTVAAFLVCLYALPAVWIAGLVDAYRGAIRANRRS
jgi:hypothetical protein